jgi:hypothetical protein
VADGRSVTALDLLHPAAPVIHPAVPVIHPTTASRVAEVALWADPAAPAPVAPFDAIPPQAGPALTISLTQGCEAPLEALKGASEGRAWCHPCDEAIVRLLVGRAHQPGLELLVCPTVRPGTLRLG